MELVRTKKTKELVEKMTLYEYNELSAWSFRKRGTLSVALSPFSPSSPSPRTMKEKKSALNHQKPGPKFLQLY